MTSYGQGTAAPGGRSCRQVPRGKRVPPPPRKPNLENPRLFFPRSDFVGKEAVRGPVQAGPGAAAGQHGGQLRQRREDRTGRSLTPA